MKIETILHDVATGKISRSDVRHAKDMIYIQKDPAGGGWMSLENGTEKVEPERFDLLIEIHRLFNPKDILVNIESDDTPSTVFNLINRINNETEN